MALTKPNRRAQNMWQWIYIRFCCIKSTDKCAYLTRVIINQKKKNHGHAQFDQIFSNISVPPCVVLFHMQSCMLAGDAILESINPPNSAHSTTFFHHNKVWKKVIKKLSYCVSLDVDYLIQLRCGFHEIVLVYDC